MTAVDIQQALLRKLEEYGESVLESSEKKRKRKKRPKTDPAAEHNDTISSNKNFSSELEADASSSKKRKKKRKNLHDNEAKNTNTDETQESSSNKIGQTGKIRHLESIKSDLGLAEFKNNQLEKERLKEDCKTKKKEPEIVVFTSHRKKKKEKTEESYSGTSTHTPEIDLRQARFEVRKFGIKGFQGDQKEEAMTSLLIRLGAKAPKNKYHNYKEYQEMRKKEMLAEKEKRELDRKLGYKFPKAVDNRKRKRDRNDIGIVDGQVGRWKSGVQFVKKNDLKGLRKSKTKF